jgi:probable metal-binding protein
MNNSEDSIHGHTIMRWLGAETLSGNELAARVQREFGDDARFHTCDSQGLSLQDLLALLSQRGKVRQLGTGWTADLSKMCGDEDH